MLCRRSTNTSFASASSTSISNLFVFVIVFPVYLQIFEHPQNVTQEELQQDLLLLPQWRREKVLSYRFLIDQVLCAKAYILLKNGLRETYGITENPAFEYVKHEKTLRIVADAVKTVTEYMMAHPDVLVEQVPLLSVEAQKDIASQCQGKSVLVAETTGNLTTGGYLTDGLEWGGGVRGEQETDVVLTMTA